MQICNKVLVFSLFILFPLVVHNLTASGQKHVELTQDTGLESLEDYLKQNNLDSTQRMAKLLLFLNQVNPKMLLLVLMSSKQLYYFT